MLETLHVFIASLNDLLWSYLLIALLIGLGLYFTVKTGFAQIRLFKTMLRETVAKRPPNKHHAIASFQAFCISTASRVGTGNIAGVAIAISLGGPGAVFWMWMIALIGAASSLIESTLAQVYKIRDKNGYRGGPAYYMQKGLNAKKAALFFAIITIFCYGFAFNAVQANTISASLHHFGTDPLMVGLMLGMATGIIVTGGLHRIAHVTQYLIPLMAMIYLSLALWIMLNHFSELPALMVMIVKNALGFEQVAGGSLGAAILHGIKRGLYSNEAGMGSVPNVAATAEVSHPVKQGLVQTLGVFVDTLLICTATAFIVLLTDSHLLTGIAGVQITQAALHSQIGHWGNYFLTLCIFLFAFSSIIGNYYYGETNLEFINAHPYCLYGYRLLAVLFVVLGSVAELVVVWNIADLFMALMALTNLIAIALLSRIAFAVFKDYMEQKKLGVDPVFKARLIKGLRNTEVWED